MVIFLLGNLVEASDVNVCYGSEAALEMSRHYCPVIGTVRTSDDG
jgi:hypothetical protein